MPKKEVLLEIIQKLYAFEEEKGPNTDYSFGDFLGYLNSHQNEKSVSERKIGGDEAKWIDNEHRSSHSDITVLLVLLYRYAKNYLKKVLRTARIQTPDEFSFLITLISFKSLTKSELIAKQVMEKTSGTEVIKRLLKQEMIHEFPDPEDGRSIRVAITEKGKEEVLFLLPQMGMVSKIVSGNLSAEETTTLLYLLRKLDQFHHDIYETSKDENLYSLISRI